MEREIIYLTVNGFPVAVERVIHPELRGKPVIVAPPGGLRSVVTALSSEAWNAGIRKGMALAKAMRYCRSAIVLPPNEPLYSRASRAIFRVLENFSPVLEPSGHGHAYMDITGTGRLFGPPRDTAWRAQNEIRRQLHLDSLPRDRFQQNGEQNRFGSGRRPAGLQDVPPGNESSFLSPLPVRLLPGIGGQTERSVRELNIRIVRDIAAMKLEHLTLAFGRFGIVLHQRARGIDGTPVNPLRAVPALEHEKILPEDSNDYDLLRRVLFDLCDHAGEQLRERKQRTGRLELRVRYSDYREDGNKFKIDPSRAVFGGSLRARPAGFECDSEASHTRAEHASAADGSFLGSVQLELFADPKPERQLKLESALDRLRQRYGKPVISRQSSVSSA